MNKFLVASVTALAFTSAALYATPAIGLNEEEQTAKADSAAKPALPDFSNAPYVKGRSGQVSRVMFHENVTDKCLQVYDNPDQVNRVLVYSYCDNGQPSEKYYYAVWMSRPSALAGEPVTFRGYMRDGEKWVFEQEVVR